MKDDRVYLGHILRCISRIEAYTGEGRERFISSDLIQDGVIRNLQTLSESSQRLSDRIKERYTEVDCKGLSGFRNVLVHDYLGVDLEQIYRVVEKDVPGLKHACTSAMLELRSP